MQKIIEVTKLIEKYNMKPHIEGGYFIRHYEAEETIVRDSAQKCKIGSAIYYLLEKHNVSQYHSITSDELWHFYLGGLLEIHIINHGNYQIKYLGNSMLYNQAHFCIPIQKGSIFSAKVIKGDYVFVGCSLHPEFILNDFKMYTKDELIKLFPQFETHIVNFFKISNEIT